MEILYAIAIAVLSLQIAYHSYLAEVIKSKLKLNLESKEVISKLSKQQTWLEITSYNPLLYPLVLLLTLYFNVHYFVLNLINCPYCIGFHLTRLMLVFRFDYDLEFGIVAGLLNIIIISLANKLLNE